MAMNLSFIFFFQVGFLRYLATPNLVGSNSGVSCKV
jgi:hypothetical protein